ncbi:MAG TPA: ComEA family DNA-binding protein [Ktedonobacterales bacterium]|nr:ComEA family DNA-binding protein [Ktedonobacterales bacterium]
MTRNADAPPTTGVAPAPPGMGARLADAAATFIAGPAFVPLAVAASLVSLLLIYVQLSGPFGWPALWNPPPVGHTVQITGSGGAPNATLKAYVLGAVAQPGVYGLPADARVEDLVRAAGGLLPDADVTRVDLAAHVADGQQVYVPRVGEVISPGVGALVNINTATAQELHNALGLSLTLAERIVAFRVGHGNFTAVSQLLLVPISRSTYDRIKYLVTI